MTIRKEEVLDLLRQMPDEVDVEELIYRLYLFEKVQAINQFFDIDLVRHLTKQIEHFFLAYRHRNLLIPFTRTKPSLFLITKIIQTTLFCRAVKKGTGTFGASPLFLTLATPSAPIPRIRQATVGQSALPTSRPSDSSPRQAAPASLHPSPS